MKQMQTILVVLILAPVTFQVPEHQETPKRTPPVQTGLLFATQGEYIYNLDHKY